MFQPAHLLASVDELQPADPDYRLSPARPLHRRWVDVAFAAAGGLEE